MPPPTKEEREICWGAKDQFWSCLEKNNENESMCQKFRKEYEKNCSAQWVKHFDRRRKYEKFKEEMEKKDWKNPSDGKNS